MGNADSGTLDRSPPGLSSGLGDKLLPVSSDQRRLWLLDQIQSAGAAYNIPIAFRLSGQIDFSALNAAFEDVVARHEPLRTVIVERDGALVQRIFDPEAHRPFWSKRTVSQSEVYNELINAAQHRFEVTNEAPLRGYVFVVGRNDCVMLFLLHHLAGDGWSRAPFLRDFETAYRARLDGSPAKFSPLPVQYRDYIQQRDDTSVNCHSKNQDLAEQASYWQAKLTNLPEELSLPRDRERTDVPSFSGQRYIRTLSPVVSKALSGLAKRNAASLLMVLQTSVAIALSRIGCGEDIPLGSPISARTESELEDLVGFFVNSLVLRVNVGPSRSFKEVLQHLRNSVFEALENKDIPFEQVVDIVNPRRTGGRNPLFQTVVAFEDFEKDVLALPGVEATPLHVDLPTSKFDLSFIFRPKAPGETDEFGLELSVEYATDLFDEKTVIDICDTLWNIFEAAAKGEDCVVAEIPLLSKSRSDQILREWNKTARVPRHQFLFELVEECAQKVPGETAIITDAASLSYDDLNKRTNQLARFLIAQGIGPEDVVAVCCDRTAENIVAQIAVTKAGAAFLPMDSAHPPARLKQIYERAHAKLALTTTTGSEMWARRWFGLNAPTVKAKLQSYPVSNVAQSERKRPVDPESSAYLIFTSGSTGEPKGVVITHQGIPSLAVCQASRFSLSVGSRMLQFASASFDASIMEMLMAFAAGATLVIPSSVQILGDGFEQYLSEKRVTHLFLTPTALATLNPMAATSVSHVMVGGEACSGRLVDDWSPGRTFINAYGPTEITICATMSDPLQPLGGCPIGRPNYNTQVYILDESLSPVPPNVPGELYIGGSGLARGYYDRPDLTAERFVANPFGSDGSRLYRTGDIAKWRHDGNIEYLGRADNQLKIGGFRIEPGEIEAALLGFEEIGQAAVVIRRTASGAKQLHAYVVAASGLAADDHAITMRLLDRLPAHLVPTAIVWVAAIPRTLSGKLDVAALPQPTVEKERPTGPLSVTERQLADLVRLVLGLQDVDMDRGFFDLGGDSIGAILLVSKARKAGVSFTPPDVFRSRTLRHLANCSVPIAQSDAYSGAIEATGSLEASPIFAWCFEEAKSISRFCQTMLVSVPADLSANVIVAALDQCVATHDIFRLRVSSDDKQSTPFSILASNCTGRRWDFKTIALDPNSPLEPKIRQEVEAAADRISIQDGPLLAAVWFNAGKSHMGRLLIVAHHLAVDAVSWHILIDDIRMIVEAQNSGGCISLPESITSYRAWSSALRSTLPKRRPELSLWRAILEKPDPQLSDVEFSRTLDTHSNARTLVCELDANITDRLLCVARKFHGRTNEVLLGGLAAAIRRFRREAGISDESGTLIDTESHGREDALSGDLSRTVGWFTSLYPVWVDPGEMEGSSNRHLLGALKRVKEQIRKIPNNGVGYGVLRYLDEESRPVLERYGRRQIGFNYLGRYRATLSEPWASAPEAAALTSTVNPDMPLLHPIDLNCFVEDRSDGSVLVARWTWSPRIHERADIERLASHWFSVLSSLAELAQLPGSVQLTPSDVPFARLDQEAIEAIEEHYGAVEDILPTTSLQRGIVFSSLFDRAHPHHMQRQLSISGLLDEERLRESAARILRIHTNLSAALHSKSVRSPVQVIPGLIEVPWKSLDLSSLDDASRARALSRSIDEDFACVFDLEKPPLLRFTLIKRATNDHLLLVTAHHVLLDGWSLRLLTSEIFNGYAFSPTADSSSVSAPFGTFVKWIAGQNHDRARQKWRASLHGFKEPTMLARRGPIAIAQSSSERGELKRATYDRLSALANHAGVTISLLFQVAWGIALCRVLDRDDVVFGTTVSGRTMGAPYSDQAIGLLTNTIPFRFRLNADETAYEVLRRLHHEQVELLDAHYVDLASIEQLVGIGELFDTLIVVQQHLEQYAPTCGDLKVEFVADRGGNTARYPLSITVTPGDACSLEMNFHETVLTREKAISLLNSLEAVLSDISVEPLQPISPHRSATSSMELRGIADFSLPSSGSNLAIDDTADRVGTGNATMEVTVGLEPNFIGEVVAQLSEVEHVIILPSWVGGEPGLTALVTPTDPASSITDIVRRKIEECLTQITRVNVKQLDTMPTTASGFPDLIDVLYRGDRATEQDYGLDFAEVIRTVWSVVLGTSSLNHQSDFFSLGGHSLTGAHMLAWVNEMFETDLAPGILKKASTPALLATEVMKSAQRRKPSTCERNLDSSVQTTTRPATYHWPNPEWEITPPSESGINATRLGDIIKKGVRNGLSSLLVSQHGRLIAEAYYYPFKPGIKHALNSATKAIVSTLAGIASDDGLLNLNQPLSDFFDSIVLEDTCKGAITIQNLLDMRSGIRWVESLAPTSADVETHHEMMRSADWIGFILRQPVAAAPGAQFCYNSGNVHLLSAILERVTKGPLVHYAKTKLFSLLGITDFTWGCDPQGVTLGSHGLSLHPRDMAKIGHLYCAGGRWGETTILPKDWTMRMRRTATDVYRGRSYANLFWAMPTKGVYFANGSNRQLILIFPELGLVVTTTGTRNFGPIEDFIDSLIGIVDPGNGRRTDSDGRHEELSSIARDICAPCPLLVNGPVPEFLRALSGRTVQFEPNSLGIQTLKLGLEPSGAVYEAEIHSLAVSPLVTRVRCPLGIDGFFGAASGEGQVCDVARATWDSGGSVTIQHHRLGIGKAYEFHLSFTGEHIRATIISDRTNISPKASFATR